ncbi:phosphatidate cytidylyltransferase [Pseudomonadales bacterium]|jgi:phosphatidate cytidylyltransferase|nr:phosphatidate cytidylyltransferase [Pseudomonadales bacterium]
MLRNRVYTALGLAALTVLTIFAAPLWLFGLVFAVAASVGAYEWAGFSGLVSKKQRLIYVAGAILLGILLLFQPSLWQDFVLALCLIWGAGFITLLWHPKFSNIYRNRWFVGGLGWMLMVGAWVCLISLVQLDNGKLWLLWMFVLTTATDVGAFFVGRAYGVNALAPKLSPGKTREGALGGIALALAICVSALVLTGALSLYEAIGLTLTMSVISIFGDLFESLLKRVSGVKDSGDILPGHGGVLDRIDSIIAVLPFLVWSLA